MCRACISKWTVTLRIGASPVLNSKTNPMTTRRHGHSLLNTDTTVGWVPSPSAVMMRLSVKHPGRDAGTKAGCDTRAAAAFSSRPEGSPSGVGRGNCAKWYGNYSSWHGALKWEQTAFCKKLWMMKTAEDRGLWDDAARRNAKSHLVMLQLTPGPDRGIQTHTVMFQQKNHV